MKFQTYVDSLTAAQKAREKFYEKKKQQEAVKSNVEPTLDIEKDETIFTEVYG